MSKSRLINYFIAAVWLINGFVCKVLNLVPRHQEIVARIVGNEHAVILTKAIGIAEIGMAFWIISGYKKRLNAIIQIAIIATMNILEFILVPDLLLWGRFNLMFAILLIALIWCNAFYLKEISTQ
jgi:hypothetical protein